VAVADRCWLHKRSRLDLASPRRAGVAVSSVGEIAGTETVDWHGILTLQLDYVCLVVDPHRAELVQESCPSKPSRG